MVGPLKPTAVSFPTKQEIAANPIVTKHREPRAVDLALDISSSCIGWAIGLNKVPFIWGKLVFKSTAEIGEKLVAVDDYIKFLLEFYNPNRLFIETPLTRKGSTTKRHNEIVGVVRKVWREVTGREVLKGWFVSAKSAKAVLGVEPSGDHKENKKRMVERINSLLGLKLVYSTSKLQTDDDTADALAVLVSKYMVEENKKMKKAPTKGRKSRNASSVRK